jgi:hypothetical protein
VGYKFKSSDNTYCDNICPELWTDNGDSCSNLGNSYGRSYGYLSDSDCRNPSNWELTSMGCGFHYYIYQYFALCAKGYYINPYCCYCNYAGCPSPMSGGGSTCTKHFYLRPSTHSICPPGLVFGTDDKCYPPCLNGYDGDFICSV